MAFQKQNQQHSGVTICVLLIGTEYNAANRLATLFSLIGSLIAIAKNLCHVTSLEPNHPVSPEPFWLRLELVHFVE